MRAQEFLTEWLYKKRVGSILVLVSDHAQDRAAERGIPWAYVERIVEHIPTIPEEKIEQMLNFDQFYIRDDETWIEAGCAVRSDGSQIALYVNTAVRREPDQPRIKPVLKIKT